jgi:hypothetical protein
MYFKLLVKIILINYTTKLPKSLIYINTIGIKIKHRHYHPLILSDIYQLLSPPLPL